MRKALIPLILAGSLALMGNQECEYSSTPEKAPVERKADYLGEFSTYSESGVALTNGDFDGDGDLDLIVASYKDGSSYQGLLYFFENDGKANFTKRMYPKLDKY